MVCRGEEVVVAAAAAVQASSRATGTAQTAACTISLPVPAVSDAGLPNRRCFWLLTFGPWNGG